jgi:restriction system protein
MAKRNGPEFLRFCIPIVEVLRELGGSGRPAEVTDLVIDRMRIPEAEQEVTNKNGGSRIRNQIAWARFYMVKAGLISSSQRGIWDLTEKGRASALDREFVLTLFRGAQREAIRDGATPIELVDGDKLVEMFEALGLGLRPKKDYEIDQPFFDQYR